MGFLKIKGVLFMLRKGFFLIASIFTMVSCGQFQELASSVSDLEGNIPSFEEFLAQEEHSQKEDSSLENFLTQEESLKKCEEKKIQKKVLLDLCQKSFARGGTTPKCIATCQKGSWKIEENFQISKEL